MALIHSLNVDVAVMCGCHAALLFNSIVYWTAYNESNKLNEHDGKYWAYNSMEAWQATFPYLSNKQIRTALDKLISAGLVETGCYNKIPFDRTLWYTITEKGKEIMGYSIGQKSNVDLPYRANESFPIGQMRNATEGEPIPYINTYINNNNNICSEHSSSPYNLPLSDGTLYNIPLEDIEKYKAAYPEKDIENEILRMGLWCDSNPQKLKTLKGIKRFITHWLSSEKPTLQREIVNSNTDSSPEVDPHFYDNWRL